MSSSTGPKLITDGLILDLDIANRKQLLRQVGTSLIDTSQWADGQADGIGIYSPNGSAGENARVMGTDPWGNTSVLWETRANGGGNDDGGWNTNYQTIDRSKLYRLQVWVRRTSSTGAGTFYFGTNSNGGVYQTQDSTEKGNPYWECQSAGSLTQNQWYLVCGFIYPAGTTHTGNHPDSGYYIPGSTVKIKNNNYCNIGGELKWGPTSTLVQHRCYHYYCGDNTTRLQFADPRIEACDGSEPSIYELVNNGVTQIKDNSSYKNHHYIQTGYVPIVEKAAQLNGSTHGFIRGSGLTGVQSNCTIVIYYKTTDSTELWVKGSYQNGVYVSASSGNAYYHGAAGAPTNYVDLQTVVNPTTPINYRDGAYHMWEAKNVDLSGWTSYEWFLYPSGWQLAGDVAKILVYNRPLTDAESASNFISFRSRFGI